MNASIGVDIGKKKCVYCLSSPLTSPSPSVRFHGPVRAAAADGPYTSSGGRGGACRSLQGGHRGEKNYDGRG